MKKTALGLPLSFFLLFSVVAILLVNLATAFYGYLPTIIVEKAWIYWSTQET
jgi:hypothetical protein